MPRRKALEVEIPPTTGRTKTVNAKHKIEYDAPVTVADDVAPDEEIMFEENTPEEVERRHKRKTARDEREEIRREMESLGVVSPGDLKLMIEKYKHSESPEAGTQADKIYCTKYICTREHIMNHDYLDVAAKWGAGRYWFTLRHKNKIVKPWEREITAPGFQNGQIVQRANPNDPTSPQVVVNMPEGQHAATVADPFKEAERALGLVKKYNEAFGGHAANQAPQRTDEEVLATAILKQPDMVENVVGNVIKRFGRSGGDDDPSPWSVALKLVESGQAATIVKTIIDSFFNGVNTMIPGRQTNGQAPMVQAQIPPTYVGNPQHPQQPFNQAPGQSTQALTQGMASIAEAGAPPPAQQLSPEQEALGLVIHHCKNKVPVKITYAELSQREQRLDLLLNHHAAQTGQVLTNQIGLYLDIFADMSSDDAIEFVRGLPDGAEVASLPHAKEWTEQLQSLIRESQEGDEEA